MNQKLLLKSVLPTAAFFCIMLIFFGCDNSTHSSSNTATKKDSLAFGDTKFLSNGLVGKMYLLQPGTAKLPLFDTMQPVNTIYTDSINIPERSWASGFPGLPGRFEWFGIEYNGQFNVIKPGLYTFRLLSDDGSKLFIDDSLIINNDGLHGAYSKTGVIDLNNAEHKIKVQYMQGPRYSIALQLFASLDKEKEQSFPGEYFAITSAHESFFTKTVIYILTLIIILLAFIVVYSFRKRRRNKG